MHLKILVFTITSQMLLFASDTKSCGQACEKTKSLFAKMDVLEDLVLIYLFLIFCISWVYGGVFVCSLVGFVFVLSS